MTPNAARSTDILVIGSGIAGLLFSLRAARQAKVLIATKKEIFETNTNYAQGGLAAAVSPSDSAASHFEDTLNCGDSLCAREIVAKVVGDAPDLIEELSELGVPFSRAQNHSLDLGLEGGHTRRRIVHAKDFTGRALESTLVKKVKENPNIQVLENAIALDLLLDKNPKKVLNLKSNRVQGARFLGKGISFDIYSRIVVLASGGAGKVYLITTNPEIATGDGMAMAYRAGCALSNLEFVQFHPTCLYHPGLRNFLISEAVRGEGGVLRNVKGGAFMKHYDRRGDLAPRDIVARAIDEEMKKTGSEHVWLDATNRRRAFLEKRFPNIFKRLLTIGLNMAKDLIPVAPAAHYFCGGVATDGEGQTEIKGLYAIGEVAYTGLHGANRLASNSLLEACAFARYAAQAIKRACLPARQETLNVKRETRKKPRDYFVATRWGKQNLEDTDDAILVAYHWDEIRRLMSNYVGLVRSQERLKRALNRLELIEREVRDLAKKFRPSRDLAELVNIATLSRLIVESALWRKESRGLHFRLDYPKKDKKFEKPSTALFPKP